MVFAVGSIEIKQHMRQAIATGVFQPQEVVILKISLQNLNALSADGVQCDELKYSGKMYDVISIKQQAGLVVIKCLCDEDEDNLIAAFLQAMQKSDHAAGKHLNAFGSVFSPFILAGIDYYINYFVKDTQTFLHLQTAVLNGRFLHVPTPPPWQVA